MRTRWRRGSGPLLQRTTYVDLLAQAKRRASPLASIVTTRAWNWYQVKFTASNHKDARRILQYSLVCAAHFTPNEIWRFLNALNSLKKQNVHFSTKMRTGGSVSKTHIGRRANMQQHSNLRMLVQQFQPQDDCTPRTLCHFPSRL